MTELLTAAQMRAIEQAAIDSGEVTGLELMERAGHGVVEAIFEEWPELAQTSHRAVVLCGPGNNGGDGFVVARLLKEWGWEVEVLAMQTLTPDAQANRRRWEAQGAVDELTYRLVKDSIDADLYIDAVFGTGLRRPVTGELGKILRYLAGYGGDRSFFQPRLLAVDVPSGLSSDTGKVPGAGADERVPACPFCRLTVSFHRMKTGHCLGDGPGHCGKVVVKSIGLETCAEGSARLRGGVKRPPGRADGRCPTVPPGRIALIQDTLPSKDLRKRSAHKYSHGHALVLSGGPGKGGAGRLAARGALRIGAGLVTLGCPPAALPENAAQLNAIMLKPLGSDEDLSLLLDGDARMNALCLGPGLGTGARERQLVTAALAAKRATVLDADALTLVASDDAIFAALHEDCVLTPHTGEFTRLFPDIAEKLAAEPTEGPAFSKVDATREAAKRAGCTVLFKGPDTVIAAPDGCCSVNSAQYDRAAPWLATAGSGDVLAGFIAGLLARGFAPMQAAETAAWLHVDCALNFGPGLIAEDLPEILPQVFRDLGI